MDYRQLRRRTAQRRQTRQLVTGSVTAELRGLQFGKAWIRIWGSEDLILPYVMGEYTGMNLVYVQTINGRPVLVTGPAGWFDPPEAL